MANCKQCGAPMNPIEAMINIKHGVCKTCCRENHKAVIRGK